MISCSARRPTKSAGPKPAGKIAALMGVEGGHMINNASRRSTSFHGLGVRYMTLTHTVNTEWADPPATNPRTTA